MEFIRTLKLKTGCVLCGYKEHPSALQFDHVDLATKRFTISECISRGWATLHEELPKCRILCANCHAIHTFNQQKAGMFAPSEEVKNA